MASGGLGEKGRELWFAPFFDFMKIVLKGDQSGKNCFGYFINFPFYNRHTSCPA